MKIGIFTDTFTPSVNGAITSICMLKEEFEKMGHTVYVITTNNKKHDYDVDTQERIIRLPGMPIPVFDYRLSNPYQPKARKLLGQLNIDVIHSHSDFSVGLFSRSVAKKFNIPVVHTYHTLYEEQAFHVTKGHFKKLTKKVIIKMAKYFCEKTADIVITPTEKTKKVLVENYNIQKEIKVIPTGINVKRFKYQNLRKTILNKLKRSYNLTSNDFVIVTLSRLGKEKSIDFLIKAMPKLITYKKHIKLLIVGDGPEKPILEELTKELNVTDNVIFTGKVPLEEVPYYYHLGKVFATASTTETQGLTILEAMASSLVPLCIEDDSYKIIVNDEENGFYFQNEDDYVEKVKKLSKNVKLLERMSRRAECSAETLNSEEYAKNVLEVYQKVIANKKTKCHIEKS